MENEVMIRYRHEIGETAYYLDIDSDGHMEAKLDISDLVRENSRKLPALYVSDLAFRLSVCIDGVEEGNEIMRIDYDNPVDDIFSGPMGDYESDETENPNIIVDYEREIAGLYRDGMTESLIELAGEVFEILQGAGKDLGFGLIAYEDGIVVKIKDEVAMEASELEDREEPWEGITNAMYQYLSEAGSYHSIISVTHDGQRRVVGFYGFAPIGLGRLDEELRDLCYKETKDVLPKGLLPVTLET